MSPVTRSQQRKQQRQSNQINHVNKSQRQHIIKQHIAVDAATNGKYSWKRVAKAVTGLLGFAAIATAAMRSHRDPIQALKADHTRSLQYAKHYCTLSNASSLCQIARIETAALEEYMKTVEKLMNVGVPQAKAFNAAETIKHIPHGNVHKEAAKLINNAVKARNIVENALVAKHQAEMQLTLAQQNHKNAVNALQQHKKNATRWNVSKPVHLKPPR